MTIGYLEREQLADMLDNVRRHVYLLELCWSCQRISECEPVGVDDGPMVWLCGDCAELQTERTPAQEGLPCWPMIP